MNNDKLRKVAAKLKEIDGFIPSYKYLELKDVIPSVLLTLKRYREVINFYAKHDCLTTEQQAPAEQILAEQAMHNTTAQPAPEPVDDKELAAALGIVKTWPRSVPQGQLLVDAAKYLANVALRAAQQEVKLHKELFEQRDKELKETLEEAVKIEDERNALKREVARLSKPLCKNAVEMLATAEVQKEVAELREWKRQCMEVWNSWDVQAVGKLLGVPLGKPIHPAIAPGIEALQAEVKELRKDKERLEAAIKHERSALYIYRDRQNGTASHKDITTGIELLDAALYPRAAGEGKGAT